MGGNYKGMGIHRQEEFAYIKAHEEWTQIKERFKLKNIRLCRDRQHSGDRESDYTSEESSQDNHVAKEKELCLTRGNKLARYNRIRYK